MNKKNNKSWRSVSQETFQSFFGLSERPIPRDLIHFGALEAINSGINLNRDFGFNHTVSGVDLWSRWLKSLGLNLIAQIYRWELLSTLRLELFSSRSLGLGIDSASRKTRTSTPRWWRVFRSISSRDASIRPVSLPTLDGIPRSLWETRNQLLN